MFWVRTAHFTFLIAGTLLVFIPVSVLSNGVGPSVNFGSARWAGFPLLVLAWVTIACATWSPSAEAEVSRLPTTHRANWSLRASTASFAARSIWGCSSWRSLRRYRPRRRCSLATQSSWRLLITSSKGIMKVRLFGDAYARYRKSVPRWPA